MKSVSGIGEEVIVRVAKDAIDKVKYPAVCRVDVVYNEKPFVFWIDLFDTIKEFGESYDGWAAGLPHYISNQSLKELGPTHKRLSRDTMMAGEILMAELNKKLNIDANGKKVSLVVKSKTVYRPKLEARDASEGTILHLDVPRPTRFLSLKKLLRSLGLTTVERTTENESHQVTAPFLDGGENLQSEQFIDDKSDSVIEVAEDDVDFDTNTEQDKADNETIEISKEPVSDLNIEDEQSILAKLSSEDRSNAIRDLQDLRHIPILDSSQESVKRANIFNGRYQVIDGGPGTGKTTSLIQRIKFLSSNSIGEYITSSQLERLQNIEKKWLFLSPSALLKEYLSNAMSKEGLRYLDESVFDWDQYRTEVGHAYGIYRTSFKPIKKRILGDIYRSSLYKNGPAIVRRLEVDFLRFAYSKVKTLKSTLLTSNYSTNSILSIKEKALAQFEKYEEGFTSIKDVFQLYASIQVSINDKFESNEIIRKSNLAAIYDENRRALNELAFEILDQIIASKNRKYLFQIYEPRQHEMFQNDGYIMKSFLGLSDNSSDVSSDELKNRCLMLIKDVLKKHAIKASVSDQTISAFTLREAKAHEVILQCTDNFKGLTFVTDDKRLKDFFEILSFRSQFSQLGSGAVANVIDKILPWFKEFRNSHDYKEAIRSRSEKMFSSLLDENRLHSEETSYLIGQINNFNSEFQRWLNSSRESFRKNTKESSSSLTRQYKNHVRPIICVDEVSDFSLIDIFCITSFKHPDLSTVTFCGDLLQRTSVEGIRDWNDLDSLLSRQIHTWKSFVDVQFLDKSYRQSHSLVSIARELYKSQRNVYPKYHANWPKIENEPRPALYISSEEDARVNWIAERVEDIWLDYSSIDVIPTVAVFVPSEDDIDSVAELFRESDILYDRGIKVVGCKDGKVIGSKSSLRIFSVENIKGLEFEAVFFFDIDKMANMFSKDLTRQFLYVGVSRAAYHLSMTSSTQFPEYLECIENNVDIINQNV